MSFVARIVHYKFEVNRALAPIKKHFRKVTQPYSFPSHWKKQAQANFTDFTAGVGLVVGGAIAIPIIATAAILYALFYSIAMMALSCFRRSPKVGIAAIKGSFHRHKMGLGLLLQSIKSFVAGIILTVAHAALLVLSIPTRIIITQVQGYKAIEKKKDFCNHRDRIHLIIQGQQERPVDNTLVSSWTEISKELHSLCRTVQVAQKKGQPHHLAMENVEILSHAADNIDAKISENEAKTFADGDLFGPTQVTGSLLKDLESERETVQTAFSHLMQAR